MQKVMKNMFMLGNSMEFTALVKVFYVGTFVEEEKSFLKDFPLRRQNTSFNDTVITDMSSPDA